MTGADPRAGQLRPGTTVRNPLGQPPWVLDIVAVQGPDAEQMVTLLAVQGTVRVADDWPVQLYTTEDADLESSLLLEEATRLGDLGAAPPRLRGARPRCRRPPRKATEAAVLACRLKRLGFVDPRLPRLQVSGFSTNASRTRSGPVYESKDFTMTTPTTPDASSPRDPMAPLSFAPSFTAPYEVKPGAVRYWRGMSGRVYADHDGWFHHPEAERPLAALSAWFSDGPMTEVTSTR